MLLIKLSHDGEAIPHLEFIIYSPQAPPINILLTQRKLPSAGASQGFLIEIYQDNSQKRVMMRSI